MIRLDLASQAERSADALSSLLGGIDSGRGRDRTLKQFEAVCLHLHTLAAAFLLVEGEPQAFHEELCRAAWQWRRLLRIQHSQGWLPPPASRNMPLLGAVLAGHWDLARDVAALSTTTWQQGEEYEDDACWAILLQEVVLARADGPSRIDALLAKLEQLGGEQNEHRCAWVRSLSALNASSLADSFVALHAIHGEQIERRVLSMTASAEKLAPYRYLWFEGLALLSLSARAGLPVREGYFKYCPPLARVPMERPFREDELQRS
ncbi:hypothetical protein F0U60_00190 [Archangium minus]|uniref:Uncharacterized protein n=1 Tax=Archangium minus TaxID=83450 RepID=A0ABY9WFW4_9BACT|nr:hypothetical protein F0U61_00190 [Archangium violaceum]WNG42684.1 hypothetical protein F0U60_00190 [Archangium minus]